MFDDKVVLITGGTGSFGRRFASYMFANYKVKKLIIFSRDEFKQHEMSIQLPPSQYPIRYFLGDIRDRERLFRAFNGVDYVVHAAALKHVLAAEYNPFEVVKTNIIGAQNIVEAAIDNGVKKVIALSTDKAVSPVNLYGATKLAMEKIFIAASSYVGTKETRFSVVRYGNVAGSRGSVIPMFIDMYRRGIKELPVTDERMTRFWMTINESVEFVNNSFYLSTGGEVFVPKIPSMRVVDLVRAIADDCRYRIVGVRPGEKIHETLISSDESRTAFEYNSNGIELFVLFSRLNFEPVIIPKCKKCRRLTEEFTYRSDTNTHWLTVNEMKETLKEFQ
ncbi:MAG: UDP-N-acetylglucosamine 4,6-dehydratase (inverting) [Candidatus Magnetominusculus sp. LBB02]|nr:UDP-N-acetylglucosamine 4,6-dehydratase (inverting) [Candidatus Magnetominusculus sp. LBB02]